MPTGEPVRNFKKLDLSQVDVPELLRAFDVKNMREEGSGEIRFSCPLPAHRFGDLKPSAYMKKGSTAWNCKSCGAQGNAVTFIADVAEVSRSTARRWIVEKWLPHTVEIQDVESYLRQMFDIQSDIEEEPEQILPEAVLEGRRVNWEYVATGYHLESHLPPPALTYLLERGLSVKTLTDFETCYDDNYDRPCLLVRNIEGEIVGFKSRAWRDGEDPKYLYLGDTERSIASRGVVYGFTPCEGSAHVYGLHNVQPYYGNVIVVEGELNAMMLRQQGYMNAVAPAGSVLSDRQVDLVVSCAESVTLFMDSDLGDPQKEATAKMKLITAVEQFERLIPTLVVADHDGDPMVMDSETLDGLVENAIPSTVFKLNQMVGS